MTSENHPAVSGRYARDRAARAGYRPGVAQVRLVGPPDTIDAALTLLADLCGDAWQPSTRKPGRYEGGDHLQYGTLIVPVPRNNPEESDHLAGSLRAAAGF